MSKERNIREILNRDNNFSSECQNSMLQRNNERRRNSNCDECTDLSPSRLILDCCECEGNLRNRENSNSSRRGNNCCCKEAFRRSLDVLLNPNVRNLIDLTSFTLIGKNFKTSDGNTTLKTVSNCTDGLITYSDSNPLFNSTTLCDLVAVTFNICDDDPCPCSFSNKDRFINLVRRFIQPVNPRSLCCVEDSPCCCNVSKASFLADSIGPVNLRISSSAYTAPFVGFRVITVTNSIAWLINENNRVLIVCLDNIEQFG